jgi:hypothetical protein
MHVQTQGCAGISCHMPQCGCQPQLQPVAPVSSRGVQVGAAAVAYISCILPVTCKKFNIACNNSGVAPPCQASWCALMLCVGQTLLRSCRAILVVGLSAASPATCRQLQFIGLSGTLPADFISFNQLLIMELQANAFHGTVPQSWSTGFPNLVYITLENNLLSGPLPTYPPGRASTTLTHMCAANTRRLGMLHGCLSVACPLRG